MLSYLYPGYGLQGYPGETGPQGMKGAKGDTGYCNCKLVVLL